MTEAQQNLVAATIVAAAIFIAALFVAFPTPWSPMGKSVPDESHVEHEQPSIDLDEFDIPDGWEPGEGARIGIPLPPEFAA